MRNILEAIGWCCVYFSIIFVIPVLLIGISPMVIIVLFLVGILLLFLTF